MDIPNFPTDNLYKFAALAGVTTMLVSMYINYRLVELFFKDAETVLMETARNKREAATVLTMPVVEETAEVIRTRRDAFNWRYGHTKTARYLCVVFMSVGFSVAVWGFLNWSSRVQRYQDELLKLQVDSARLEAKKTPSHP